MVPMFLEDMQFDGADSGAISWGDEVSDEAKAASPVVVIGCGLSGILAGIRLSQAGLPFVIVEKDEGPGGTWWENRYPGARVDVGSHHYCYAFEPSHHWTEYFCQQPELRDYFVSVLDKYELRPHCRFGTEVTSLTWDEPTSSWQVGIRNPDGTTEVLEARFVISAVGSLNIPRLPDIPGMDSFAGPSFHSARWPDGLDLTGKRFALVGAGASGFQIAPTIADQVEQLTIFQRTTQWMLPNPLYHATVPPGDRWAMQHLPFYARWFRFLMLYPGIAMGTEQYRVDPDFRGERGHLDQRAERAAAPAADRVDHDAPRGPARPDREVDPRLPGDGEADPPGQRVLVAHAQEAERRARAHAASSASSPKAWSPSTARSTKPTSSATRPGSGTTTSSRRWSVTGRNGVSLRDQWGDEPTAYLGIAIPNFPNLFCMYGPGTNLAHGASLFFHSECQIHYAMDCIHQVLASGARTIEVRKDDARRVRRAVPRARSTSSCGHTRRSSTATTRTRRARSSRCRRGGWSCTGNGPAPPIPKRSSSADKSRRPVGSPA